MSSKLCECGCGQPAPIAQHTYRKIGHIAGEPLRFCRGHNNRKPRPFCACGCGVRVQGARAQWIKGHDKRLLGLEEPNPDGLCMCGCGKKTPIATRTVQERGWVAGKPIKYIRGHWGRIPAPVPDEAGCWIWQGTPRNHGRGVTRGQLAYRAYYEQFVGPIPEGHHLHHTCENPLCVNPEHLVPMTPSEHSQLHADAKRAA